MQATKTGFMSQKKMTTEGVLQSNKYTMALIKKTSLKHVKFIIYFEVRQA